MGVRFLTLLAVTCSVGACGWDVFEAPIVPAVGGGGSGAEGGSGGAGGGVGGGTGGMETPEGCGRIDLLQDDFSNTETDYYWYRSQSGGSVNEDNGQQLAANPGSSSGFALYRSSRRYDMTSGRVTIALDDVPDAVVGNGESAVFRIEQNDGRFAEFRVHSGDLRVGYQQTGGFQRLNVDPTPYVEADHAVLRFREEDGTLKWQVSPDGSNFTDVAEAPVTAVFPDLTRIRVAAGAAYGSSTGDSTSLWDNASGQTTNGANMWCPISTISDDFDDTFRSNEWLNTGGDAEVTSLETEGHLVFTLAPGAAAARSYVSSQAYTAVGDGVFVEIVETSAAPSTTFFELRGDSAAVTIRVVSSIDSDTMEEIKEIEAVVDSKDEDPVVIATEDFDATTHRWVRIREADGALIFERSSDAATWEEWARQSPGKVPVEDVLVALGASSTGAAPMPGQSRFDNLNLAP